MAITRVKPKVHEKAVSDFIAGAPDAPAGNTPAGSTPESAPASALANAQVSTEGRSPVPSPQELLSNEPPSSRKGVKKGKKLQISLTLSPSLLDQVDAMACALGQSRAGLITMALHQALDRGLTFSAPPAPSIPPAPAPSRDEENSAAQKSLSIL